MLGLQSARLDSADIKDGHRQKRVRAKSTVPPGVKIIDLDDDVLAASAVSRGVTNSADPFATRLSDPPSASTAPLPSYATQQEPSTPANDSAHVSSSPTLPFATPATPVQAPVHSSASEKPSTPMGGPQLPSSPTPLPCMLTVSMNGAHCFAIDCLKEHSPAISEFKTVWDGASSEMKKKYEALSKERKSANRLAAAMTKSNTSN